MGLDMYAEATKPSNINEDGTIKDWDEPEEIFYWRKHHDLHGWMEKLYREKGGTNLFNYEEVWLEEEDLERLRKDIIEGNLPPTTGFFFGNNPPDEESNQRDLTFIECAKEYLNKGYKVFYYGSW